MLKKTLRLIVKIIATPIIAPFIVFVMAMGYLTMAWNWLFDQHDDMHMNLLVIQDFYSDIKKWFTTL